jgi:hypothetical protein
MERINVTSSNIRSIGFEEGVLEIEFKNGAVYQYYDVQEHIFDELMQADSQGKYLAQNIKGYFRYSRV